LTLVGDRVARAPDVCARVRNALKQIPAMVMPAPQSDHAMVVVIPQSELSKATTLLHREFFAQPDPSLFAPCRPEALNRRENPQAMETLAVTAPSRRMRLVFELGL
jgi:hypothetical protein